MGKGKQMRMQRVMLILNEVTEKGRRMGWKGINFCVINAHPKA